MTAKVEINGVDQVLRNMKFREMKQKPRITVLIGYVSNYALAVHEAVEMKLKGQKRRKPSKGLYWDPQGKAQAKFLETPAREKRADIAKVVRTVTKATGNFEQGLVMGGLLLQRESQQLVPVDTGNLKASAFTKVDDGM